MGNKTGVIPKVKVIVTYLTSAKKWKCGLLWKITF